MLGRTGAYQILSFQEPYVAEPSFINIIFFLGTIDVLKEDNLSLI